MKTKKKPPQVTVRYERCELTTNLSGLRCPMCDAAIVPNVTHRCSRPETARTHERAKERNAR